MQSHISKAIYLPSVLNVSNTSHTRRFHISTIQNFPSSFIARFLPRIKQKTSFAVFQHYRFKLLYRPRSTLKFSPNSVVAIVVNGLSYIPQCLKNDSVKIVQNCARNLEYVLAHRLRRCQQMLCLYSKLWEQSSLQLLFNKLYKRLEKQKSLFLLSSGFVSAYEWNKERIPDEDILRYSAEMSLVEFLRDKRRACLKGTSSPADCDCPVCSAKDSEWQSFVEEDDIVVWKREEDNYRGKGLYSYKMYARYGDVTAYDFLEAQIDQEYRLSWDTHAVTLRLIDSEPDTNSDVVYWETKWPTPFNNRDYVFKRRYRIDKHRNLIFLVNCSTEHPACPAVSHKQRVREYWSYMVIKPYTTFDQPGIEFSLTYFDNPGTNMPSPLTLWVTITGMPDYVKKLRMAALGVAERRGDAPSPLASHDNGTSPVNGQVVVTQPEQSSSERVLSESLRASLFLF